MTREDIDETVKELTIEGNILLLSCMNIIDFPQDAI